MRAGRLLLDGGSMFGVVPRVVWTKAIDVDSANRIELAHNCILLERATPVTDEDKAANTPKRIIIETGTGDKLNQKMSDIFGLDGRTVETALAEEDISPDSIDAAIVTHLHFDHAGGLTRRPRDGEQPDWTAPDGSGPLAHDAIKLTFPNATIHAQEREWKDAIANTAVMTKTYYRDHLEPLELPLPDGRQRLQLIDSPRPFPTGYTPDRDELPRTTIEQRASEILPGIRVILTPGHTWGQQAVMFTDVSGQTVVFTPDVMPSIHHVGAAYSLAYDVEAYTTMVTKHWFLTEAAERDWLLVIDHEPKAPLQRVRSDGRGWFRLETENPD